MRGMRKAAKKIGYLGVVSEAYASICEWQVCNEQGEMGQGDVGIGNMLEETVVSSLENRGEWGGPGTKYGE
jgi:hypothetical protein